MNSPQLKVERTADRLDLSLQLSINAQLMRRLDALETEVTRLKKQIKDINYRESV